MCGIAGIIQPGRREWPDSPFNLSLMRHRGPDDSGVWAGRDCALGHVRLSIIDLSSGGHQPFISNSGHLILVYNGEIYNYLELRRDLEAEGCLFRTSSDTEVLLQAWMVWGEACLPRLSGMFAFALWDCRERQLWLARDRFGEKPLYFFQEEGRFLFASELQMLLSLLAKRPSLDPDALNAYLHRQYIPEPNCLLAGVKKLTPGSLLSLRAGDHSPAMRSWWSPVLGSNEQGDPVELLDSALNRAVKRCLRADVPVGLSLSGGLDSSAIAVLARRNHNQEVSALSVGYPGRLENDESPYAAQLAADLGIPFSRVLIHPSDCLEGFATMARSMDEPVADIAAFGYYSIARAAREQGIPVLLSGTGGDELFWGYGWVQESVRLSRIKQDLVTGGLCKRLPVQLGALLGAWKPIRQLIRNKSTPASLKQRLRVLEAHRHLNLAMAHEAPYDRLQGCFPESERLTRKLYTSDFASQLRYERLMQGADRLGSDKEEIPIVVLDLLLKGWLSGNCLALGDRLSMAWSVELRLPLLESGLVDTLMSLPSSRDGWSGEPKALLKAVLRRYLPAEVVDRPKRGFAPPVVDWVRGVFERYGNSLPEGVLAGTGIFRKDALSRLIQESVHTNKHLDMVYRLLLLEIWMRESGGHS